MAIDCKLLKEHMIACEILECHSTTATGTDLVIYDEGSFVSSGINILNFIGGDVEAQVSGVSQVDIFIPPTDLIKVDGGRLWVYDNTRSKWLSSDRLTTLAGRKGRSKNSYLRIIDGQAINLTGYRLARKATMTAISVQTRNTETWTLHVRKNGDTINLASLAISSEQGKHEIDTNLDFSEGDRVQFFAETSNFLGIRDPFVWAEVAWRNDNL